MARDGASRIGLELPDDRLDAVERGLEWGTAILKARRLGRQASQLRGRLSGETGSAPPIRGATPEPAILVAVGSRDQRALFESLRTSALRIGGS